MSRSADLARQIRELTDGPCMTGVHLAGVLEDLSLAQSLNRFGDLHSIAELVFHIGYYVDAVSGVLEGKPLTARDRYSYDLQPPRTEDEWQAQRVELLHRLRRLADQTERLDDAMLESDFADARYGSYYRNLQGIVEHAYYHLGQMSWAKKMFAAGC